MSKKPQPNLIYIFADQLRYDALGCHGSRHQLTPHLDQLCRDSLDLSNAVSGSPVCAPYRATLMTGKYTTSTGMVINEIRLNPDQRCFAHVLGEGGYENAYIGKWHMYANELGNHYDPKNSFIPKGKHRLGFDGFFAAYNFHHEYYAPKAYYHLDTSEKHYFDGYEPDGQVDMAIEQMARLKATDKPFSLFLSLGTPHDPWEPWNVPDDCMARVKDLDFSLPENYLPDNDRYADAWARLSDKERGELTEWMRCYYGMVCNLDDNIGRLVAALKAMDLYDNSLIVFTSDHGECFGAHGRRAKNIFYEEAVRVPFTLRMPGELPAGQVNETCFNTVNIMPTLLDLLGLPVPESCEAPSLAQYLRHDLPCDDGSLMMCCGPTAAWADGHEWRAYRNKQYTYATYRVDGSELLFDNLADPLQMNDLADSPAHQALEASLRSSMLDRMAGINDSFEANSYYREHWVENRIIVQTATMPRKQA